MLCNMAAVGARMKLHSQVKRTPRRLVQKISRCAPRTDLLQKMRWQQQHQQPAPPEMLRAHDDAYWSVPSFPLFLLLQVLRIPCLCVFMFMCASAHAQCSVSRINSMRVQVAGRHLQGEGV